MTSLREAAQQALEALEIGWSPKYVNGVDAREKGMKAIAALRDALAEPVPPIGKASTDVGVPVYVVKKAETVQEPVAWLWEHQLNDLKHYGYKPNMRAWTTERRLGSFEGLVPLYTGASQSKPMPSWLHYCPASDILIIHGRAYSGAAFAAEALAAALPQEQAR